MYMQLNPIVKKDVKVQSRSMRICWGVFAYELILALAFFLAMIMIEQQSRYSTSNLYSAMVWLYPVLAVTQLGILGLIVPVRTASAISGEKERQTFDIMMTTSMTPFSIIIGKVMTAIVQSMFFVIASMPVMALSFVLGGMSWGYLFGFLGIALLVCLFSASVGILCSSICKKSISAVIMSYGIYIIFFLGTVLPYILYEIAITNTVYVNNVTTTTQTSYNYGENLYLFLLINPAVYLAEFFVRVMTGQSMVNTIPSMTGTNQTKGLINHVAVGNRWMIISTCLFVGISVLFLWLASRRINPIKRRAKKRSAKQARQMHMQQGMQQPIMQPQEVQQPVVQRQDVQPIMQPDVQQPVVQLQEVQQPDSMDRQ